MEYALYASLATNALGAIGLLVMAAKLADARADRDDAVETVGYSAQLNRELIDELVTYRANAEQVRRRAKIASDASAAKRRNGAAAPAVG